MQLRGAAVGHLSSCATQDPSREMAHTPRLQPGSCHVAPPARNPELVWQPDLELDSGDCLSELGRGGVLLELQTKVHMKVRNHGEGTYYPGPSPNATAKYCFHI